MVGVEVRDEDLVQVDEADRGPEQLALRPFGAVEEESVAATAYEQSRGSPLRGRHRPGRAEEDEVEIHAPILG